MSTDTETSLVVGFEPPASPSHKVYKLIETTAANYLNSPEVVSEFRVDVSSVFPLPDILGLKNFILGTDFKSQPVTDVAYDGSGNYLILSF